MNNKMPAKSNVEEWMAKSRVLILNVLLIAVIAVATVHGYTVITKSGKIMQGGTLISETADTIVFRDAKGLQFSLKKSSLDLDKMKTANAPPPPPASKETANASTEEPKKAAKVYTANDIEGLRAKYGSSTSGDTSLSDDISAAGDSMTSQQYSGFLRRAGEQVQDVVSAMQELSSGMRTAWEVPVSTGQDPTQSLNIWKAKNAGSMKQLAQSITELESIRDAFPTAPAELTNISGRLAQAITRLKEAMELLSSYDGDVNILTQDSRVKEKLGGASSDAQAMLALPAPSATQQQQQSDTTSDDDSQAPGDSGTPQ